MSGTASGDLRFDACFEALTGWAPLRWQSRLFKRMAAGDLPARIDLPTGLGKTSVIPIWLIALASTPLERIASSGLGRRLVYIVNRRTVVDQATDDAKRFLDLVESPARAGAKEGVVCRLRDALGRIAGDTNTAPLAVSTLRGELADKGEWRRNPARPAIIVGTIDMIGSKLLFCGYGDGRYGRAHHAGLIGQDTLIVHDEAHLSPAFSALLRSVEAEQKRCKESRPIRVMELSATTRGETAANGEGTFGIEQEDRADQIVKDRLNAVKCLALKDAEKAKIVEVIVSEAARLGEKPRRVLVYVRSPKTAGEVAAAIKKKLGTGSDDRVRLLTGTIRGFERDELTRSPLFGEFHSNPARTALSHTLYLVSTSAGEVGVDLDADDLACDLTTLDSMAQRFGRVNRLGGNGRSAEVVVVRENAAKPDEKKKDGKEKRTSPLEMAVAATGDILGKIVKSGGNVSPGALGKVLESEEAKAAFSPTPTILPATDILFDAWSLTSIMGEMPGRPEVEPYLHGVAEWEPPETHVAWRVEIGELAKAEVSKDQLEEMLEAFPLRAAEQLRDTTNRVIEQFLGIVKRHPGSQVILIKNSEPRWIGLPELAPADKNDKAKLNEARRLLSFATVLLPAEVGGLKDGMLDGESKEFVADVAEEKTEGQRDRQRVRVNGDVETGLMVAEVVPALRERCALKVGDPEDEDDETPRPTIEYRVAKAESGEPGEPVGLAEHSKAVEAAARRLGGAIGLPHKIVEALALAGHWHDRGKHRPVWQRYAKNYGYGRATNPAPPLAKSKKYGDARTILSGYRHEFGSLMDAIESDEIKLHSEGDLILHLIASHHGWARPHFKHDPGQGGASAYDATRPVPECQAVAADAMRRYTAHQRRFGRWGLAWLESLVRAADASASEGDGA